MQIGLELLAPAKDKNIGIAAINCGADAVYIAGQKFGARESAGNTISDISELISYAHKFKAKIYVTLNTILFDNEIDDAIKLIKQVYEAGADALIIQDLGLTQLDLPPIPLFASTQCNIRTLEQALFLEKLGFKRLILARELSLSQIREIHNQTNIELESFIHGALCVSYSGQCYLSCYLTGRSANRGECAQVCRSNYSLVDSDGKTIVNNKPLLSLKDLNLEAKIPDLIECGITSFKIEGRLKNESYVKNIVRHYRDIIDNYININNQYKRTSLGIITNGFKPNPDLTFNRGYTELFIDGKRGDWNSKEGAKYLGEYIGTITKKSFTNNGMINFEYSKLNKKIEPINNGDGLCFVSKEGSIKGSRANKCSVSSVTIFDNITISVGDKIYRNYNIEFEKSLDKQSPERLIPVSLSFIENQHGSYEIISEWDNNLLKYQINDKSDNAKDIIKAKENIINQLGKRAGIYTFTVKSVDCKNYPFYPSSILNKFRREIAELISEKIYADENNNNLNSYSVKPKEISSILTNKNLSYLANCSNKYSYSLYKKCGVSSIDKAYETKPIKGVELMRTKYCIKYELNLCPKYNNNKSTKELFLINGKNRFKLMFDCKKCEMTIIG